MVRELNFDEVGQGYELVKGMISRGCPVKEPLFKAMDSFAKILEEVGAERAKLQEKYMKVDTEGNPIPKDGLEGAPQLVTDFELHDEDAFVEEVDKLADKTYEVEFEQVPKDRIVILTNQDGSTREILLTEYLELSGNIDSLMVKFLNQYFMND